MTTIAISKANRTKLIELKVLDSETLDHIINRLLEEHNGKTY